MKKHLFLILKIVISCLLIGFVLTRINFKDLGEVLSQINIVYLIIGTIILSFSFYINALKWKALLPEKKVLYLFNMNMVSGFYSIILPGQVAGEAAKIVFMRRYDKNSQRITASVFVDKISGFIGIILVGIVGCLFSSKDVGFITWMLFSLMVMLTAVLLVFKSDRIYHVIKKINDKISSKLKFFAKVDGFIISWREYSNNNRALILNIVLGIIYQIVGVLLYFVLSKTVGLNIGIMDFSWIFSVLSLALFLPISISGLGVREITLVGFLALYGVSSEKAMALSMIILLTNIFRGLIGGVINLYYLSNQKNIQVENKTNVDM